MSDEVTFFLTLHKIIIQTVLYLNTPPKPLPVTWPFCHTYAMLKNGRAWVSDPAAARSENVALPFLFAWFALFDAKKVTSRFVPGTPGGALVCNVKNFVVNFVDSHSSLSLYLIFLLCLTEIK
jgi:hypothetical protein